MKTPIQQHVVRYTLCTLLAASLLSHTINAGTSRPFFHSLKGFLYTSDHYTNHAGQTINIPTYRKTQLNYYAHFQPDTHKWMINTFLNHVSHNNNTVTGFSDLELGYRFQALQSELGTLHIESWIIIPTGYDPGDSLPLGYGVAGLQAGIITQHSLQNIFIEYGFSYRQYFNVFYGQVRPYFATLWHATPHITIGGRIDSMISTHSENTPAILNSSDVALSSAFQLVQTELSLTYKLSDAWSVSIARNWTIHARNTGSGDTYQIGLTGQF